MTESDFVVDGESGSPCGTNGSPDGLIDSDMDGFDCRRESVDGDRSGPRLACEFDLDRLPITGRAAGFGSAEARLARCWFDRGSAVGAEKNSPLLVGSPAWPRLQEGRHTRSTSPSAEPLPPSRAATTKEDGRKGLTWPSSEERAGSCPSPRARPRRRGPLGRVGTEMAGRASSQSCPRRGRRSSAGRARGASHAGTKWWGESRVG